MNLSSIIAVARFQLAGISRRRGLWAWLALAGMLASLALPPLDAGYVTASVGKLRPLYTAEMVGLTLGVLGVTLLLPAHFAALRIAFPVSRHPLPLVAATRVSGVDFALGRWLADTLFLTGFLFCFGLGGLFVQAIRAEAPVEQPLALLGPLLLVGVPSASLLAGFRGLVEARRLTRGPVAAVVLMVLFWLLVLPLSTTVARGLAGPMADPLGVGVPMHDLGGGLPPGQSGASYGIHITSDMQGTLTWTGFDWLGRYAAARGFWLLAGAGLAAAAGLIGDRFRAGSAPGRAATERPSAGPATLSMPGVVGRRGGWGGLLAAELRLLLPRWKVGLFWLAVIIGLGLLARDADTIRRVLAFLLLPLIFRLGDLGVRAGGRSLLPIAAAVPMGRTARAAAGYAAGLAFTLVAAAGPLLIQALSRDLTGSALLVAGVAGLAPAAALLLGRLTGSGQAFSMLGLLFCYGLFSA